MRIFTGGLRALALLPLGLTQARDNWRTPPATEDAQRQISGPLTGGTADHTKFEELQGPFSSGSEVTRACLGCHTEAGKHFMTSLHGTWVHKDPVTGQLLGKKHLVNNFCTNARGNKGMCAQCHAG